MIYRTDGKSGKAYQPLDWKLYSSDRRRLPIASEEALREHLKNHPDEDFFLIPVRFFNREVQEVEATAFDPWGEPIRCGMVRYDSRVGKVVTRDAMKVTYSDRAKQGGQGRVLLQQATKRLEEVLGPSGLWVKAEWDCTEDGRGKTICTLRVSDWEGEVVADFTPDELRVYGHDLYRWRRLWGDLLQIRSEQQLAELTLSSVGEGA